MRTVAPGSQGTFPRALGVRCREKRLLSWEAAVRTMTGMPAGGPHVLASGKVAVDGPRYNHAIPAGRVLTR